MILFSALVVFPLLLIVGGFIFSKSICWREVLCMGLAQALVAGIAVGICYTQNTWDTEVWNSSITDKKQVRVSCSHSYRCRCRQSCSGSGKKRSCHEVCSTCYDHTHDFDWRVYNGIGEDWNISRVDRQGLREPERWTRVQIGEPTSTTHSYENYVKAAPDSLFRYQGQSKYTIPVYPQNIYDYYKLDRVVLVNGAKIEDPHYWNADLAALNAGLGSKKQSNAILVFVKDLPRDYFYALQQAWVGGKKNDVVVVISVSEGSKTPSWVEVMAWAQDKTFQVVLRDDLMTKTLDRWSVMPTIESAVTKYYKRQPMSDFEYLRSSITPSTTQWSVTMLISMVVAIGMLIFFHKNDPFDQNNYRRYY